MGEGRVPREGSCKTKRQKETKTEKQACIWSKRAEEEEFEDGDVISVDRNIRSRKIHMQHNYDLLRG